MVKRLFVFFSILCVALVLGSCSDSLENKSSLAFEVSEAFFRNVVGDSVSTDGSGQTSYTVKVTVSWEKDQNMVQEQSAKIHAAGEVSCPTFTFKDLPTGKTVRVDVSIYSGNVLVYKTETPVEKQLVAGENNCTVELTKCVSNVVISIQNKDEIKLDSAKEYKLRATFSGDYKRTSEWTLTAADNTFRVENLDIGKSVELDVAVYSGDLCVYKTESPVSITIAETNDIAVTLGNAISTAAVWMNKISIPTFYQSERYDSAETEFKGDGSYYTFDSDGNLWSVMIASDSSASKVYFYEYVMDSGLYTMTEDGKPYKTYTVTIGANQSVVDIYWDNSTLYALVKDGNNDTPVFYLNSYTIKGDELTAGLSSLQINLPSELTTSPSLSTLAVHDLKVVVASEDSSSVFGNTIITEKFPVDFIKIDSINSSEFSDACDVCITDLQFGDGLGNYTDKIYALVKIKNKPDNGNQITSDMDTIYSTGSLVEMDATSYKLKTFGNSSKIQEVTLLSSGNDVQCNFYCPDIDSDVENFFGPTKFVALVPKKLVILDDGVSVDKENKCIKNNDNLFEFDIAKETIKKGTKVSASMATVSGFAFTSE